MALLKAAIVAAGGAPKLATYLGVNRNLPNSWVERDYLPRHARITLRLALGLLRPLQTVPESAIDMANDPAFQEVWRQISAIWRSRKNPGDERWITLVNLLNALEPPTGRTSRAKPGAAVVNTGTNQDNP